MCCTLLENGEIITGNNQENAAYPSGLCAERVTIFHIGANYPHLKIKIICDRSGQISNFQHSNTTLWSVQTSMFEYETKQEQAIEIYFSGLEGSVFKCNSVKDLLPFSFDASFL
jgi:cytidine deaminase